MISLLLASPAPSFHWASVPKSGVTWVQFLQKVDKPLVFGGYRWGWWEPSCCVGKAEGFYCFEFRFSAKSLCLVLWLTLCSRGAWALQVLSLAGILGVMAWLLKCAFCGHRGTASSSLLDQFLKLLIFHPETRSPSFALSLLFCWDSEAPPASHAFRLKVHRHTGPGWVFPGPGARPAALPSRVCFAWHLWSTSRPVLVLGPGEQWGEAGGGACPQDSPESRPGQWKYVMLWENRGRSHLTRSGESGIGFSPESEGWARIGEEGALGRGRGRTCWAQRMAPRGRDRLMCWTAAGHTERAQSCPERQPLGQMSLCGALKWRKMLQCWLG